jgi:hypothetical protein
MTITVKRVSTAGYTCTYTSSTFGEEWSTKEPLMVDQLVEELFKRGAHQTDIGDAISEADLKWTGGQI